VAKPHREVSGYIGPVKTVLIVDNMIAERQFLAALLLPLGFRIIEASNGKECLRAARLHNPDLVLLDIAMPGFDGWETCRRLRSERGYNDPVIRVSANAFDNTSELRNEGRCNDFIVKPVMEAELLAKLGLHLNLEWTYRDAFNNVNSQRPQLANLSIPPEQTLSALRRLADMGYVKGIQRKLAEIEAAVPGYAPFVNALHARLERFEIDDFKRLLEVPPDVTSEST
jgi:CheY-like chemotaxis protein